MDPATPAGGAGPGSTGRGPVAETAVADAAGPAAPPAAEAPTLAQPPRWRALFAGPRGHLVMGLLLSEFTLAAQVLMMAAVMPAAVRDIGGLQLYGWAFSASALGALVAMPLSGRLAGRYGARLVVGVSAVVSVAGMLVSALAPVMAVLVAGRVGVGVGAGAQLTVSLSEVAQGTSAPIRARIFALMSGMWVLPGLVAPPLGGALAVTVGWRWAFVAPIPLVILSRLLMVPGLPRHGSTERPAGDGVAPAWALLLAAAATAVLAGLTVSALWTVALEAAGIPLLVLALQRVLPGGVLTARPGLPAAVALLFLLNVAYFAGDDFVPLVLTALDGRSYAEASIVVTFASLGWVASGWWLSRVAGQVSPRRAVRLGAAMIALASATMLVAVAASVPLLPYAAWTVAALGMGFAYEMLWLLATAGAEVGGEGRLVSAALLAETIAISIGPGLAGGALAIGRSATGSLQTGLLGVFAIALATAVATSALAARLPRQPAT